MKAEAVANADADADADPFALQDELERHKLEALARHFDEQYVQ